MIKPRPKVKITMKPDTGGGPVDDKYPKGWCWPTPPHKLPGGTNGGKEIL
jgi:hypothetical protein